MGTKITMISVHSNGQPKMKMMAWESSKNWIGDMSSDKTHSSTKR